MEKVEHKPYPDKKAHRSKPMGLSNIVNRVD